MLGWASERIMDNSRFCDRHCQHDVTAAQGTDATGRLPDCTLKRRSCSTFLIATR